MDLPEKLRLELERASVLRYGENPHQEGALYLDPSSERPGVARSKQLQGKELSLNNIADADAAFECAAEFTEPAAVIVKHMNPCGVAVGVTQLDAYKKALMCDPVSAFGGIVAFNRHLDSSTAAEFGKTYFEVIIAPSADEAALKILSEKGKLRVLVTGGMPEPASPRLVVRSVAGGFLVQAADTIVLRGEPKVVTKRAPTQEEMDDMKFAFTVCKHVKSNAIVYAKDGATLGIGAGQMSRIYSAKIAAMKAAEASLPLAGSVMASDAFFPFPDCVEAAYDVGATAIIQPGGSLKDQDSIDAADKHTMAMVYTGVRHFWH